MVASSNLPPVSDKYIKSLSKTEINIQLIIYQMLISDGCKSHQVLVR